ncbi:hypothetical protein AeNC1_017733, partial [Aphanomyces euteiches]
MLSLRFSFIGFTFGTNVKTDVANHSQELELAKTPCTTPRPFCSTNRFNVWHGIQCLASDARKHAFQMKLKNQWGQDDGK